MNAETKRSFIDQFSIFCLLIRRNFKVMRSHFKDFVFNGCVIAGFDALLYGYFMPQSGMPRELIGPFYFGCITLKFVYISFEKAFRDASDLNTARFMDYQFILPLSKTWLCASYVVSYIIELTFQAYLPVLFGACLIAPMLDLSHLSIMALLAVHCVAALYCSLLFLSLSFGTSFDWMVDHMWPRLLVPLLLCGSIFYPWHSVREVSPLFAKLFLLNPFTYMSEGFRAALLGVQEPLTLPVCLGMLALFIVVHIGLFAGAVKKGMDPV